MKYILLMALFTLIGSFGALFVKKGAKKFSLHPIELITNMYLIAGGALYVLASGMYVWLLQFLPLSTAYPLTSMSYIWVAILSKFFLREDVNRWRWGGICLIIVGISLVSL